MEGWDAPFKLRNHAQRLLLLPAVRARFALAGVDWGDGWRIFGMPIIQRVRGSQIQLGDRLELRSNRGSNPLGLEQPVVLATRTRDALISLGNDCGLSGVAVVAASAIRLGDRVLVGANSLICDTDFHPLEPARRRAAPAAGASAPVTIEDDVFVGTRALILKGVRIGRGAVVGAGAVVTRDVPAFSIVAGNPARVVGQVNREE